jgi:hypothetical protein
MALFKDLKELQEELQYWREYNPVNNMGKWYVSIRIEKIKRKIKAVEEELKRRKNRLEN